MKVFPEKCLPFCTEGVFDNGGGSPPAPAGATLWCVGLDDAFVAYATSDDLTSWTNYDAMPGTSEPDYVALAYGENGAGDPHWVGNWKSSSNELGYTSDPTDENLWTAVNLTRQGREVLWGNGVWIMAGWLGAGLDYIFRSTDGSTWSQIDISGLSGINTNTIFGLSSDGNGTWMFSQQRRLYKSTDNGLTWALEHTLSSSYGNPIYDINYTNNTWVVLTSGGKVASAASSDTTTWSAPAILSGISAAWNIAAAAGRVICAYSGKAWQFDVDGTTLTLAPASIPLPAGQHTARNIATDGFSWIVVHDDAHLSISTDSGDTWSVLATHIGDHSLDDANEIACNITLPL